MDGAVYDITEWAGCQRKNLKHLRPNSHNVQYRIVLGKQAQGGSGIGQGGPGGAGPGGGPTSSGRKHKGSGGAGSSAGYVFFVLHRNVIGDRVCSLLYIN